MGIDSICLSRNMIETCSLARENHPAVHVLFGIGNLSDLDNKTRAKLSALINLHTVFSHKRYVTSNPMLF